MLLASDLASLVPGLRPGRSCARRGGLRARRVAARVLHGVPPTWHLAGRHVPSLPGRELLPLRCSRWAVGAGLRRMSSAGGSGHRGRAGAALAERGRLRRCHHALARQARRGSAMRPASGARRDPECDLQAALAATRPKRSWGHVRSAEGLLMVIMHLTLCVVMSTRVKCEQRIVLPDPRPGQAFVPVYKPITPATVSQSAAHGVLAIAAAVLGSLEGKGGPRHQWRPDGASLFLDASSFVGWLPPSRRESLKALAGSWEAPAGEALRTIVDATRVGDGLRH